MVSQRLLSLWRMRYLVFVVGAYSSPLLATDLRTDVTAGSFSPAYYTSIVPRITWRCIGTGLLPNRTYTLHSTDGTGAMVQFHTNGSGAITDSGTRTTSIGGPSSSGDLVSNSCTSAGTPDCTGVALSAWTATNHIANYADDGVNQLPASGGIGAVTCHRIFYSSGAPSPQPAVTFNDIDVTYSLNGAVACSSTTASVTMSNTTGFNVATNMHVEVFVGASGSGYQMQFFLSGSTLSQSLTIPASVGDVINGGPVTVSIVNGSYAYDSTDSPITFTVSAPSTFTCGTALAITLTGHTKNTTPTPSPSAVPSPSASASATVRPTASPVISPAPFGSPTPASGTTPPPNVSVSNGGAKTDTIIDNPNDFYAPMKKAMEDAERGMSAPGDGDGGGGAFGSGNGTHDTGNYDERGHLDDLQTKADAAVTGKTGVVSGITGKLNTLKTKAISLGGQTFGSVNSISMNFNSIGNAAAVGHVTLPTTVDLVPWATMISTLRIVLLWLIRIAFFILTFRLCASQGVRV